MGVATNCLKCILIIINIVFAIIGLALLAVGIYVQYGANETINSYFSDVISGLPGLSSLANVADGTNPTSSSEIDFAELLKPVAIALIVVGVLIAGIALVGAIGICCKSKLLMIVYCILIALILVAQTLLVILYFAGALKPYMEDAIIYTIENKYVGVDDLGLYSLAWNFVMAEMECCGMNNYTDFHSSTSWNRERQFSNVGAMNLTTPIACCKFTGSWPSVTIVDDLCALYPTDLNSNWKNGCWKAVSDRLAGSKALAIGIIVAILAIQLIILLAAICVTKSYDATDII